MVKTLKNYYLSEKEIKKLKEVQEQIKEKTGLNVAESEILRKAINDLKV